MDLALGTDASKSDAKDPVRFSALLGGPEKRVDRDAVLGARLPLEYPSTLVASRA